MKIAKHIYFYKVPELKDLITSSNTIVIVGGKDQILIDPGIDLRNKWNYLLEKMGQDGLDIKKTTQVWLTHNHPDHAQLVKNVIEESGAKLCCHRLGQEILEARRPFLKMEARHIMDGGKFYKLIFRSTKFRPNLIPELKNLFKFFKLRRLKIDIFFSGGEELAVNGLKVYVLSLAGHSPDEIGFWIPKEETLIVGDLIHPVDNGQGDRSRFPVFNTFSADAQKAKESIEKMLELKNWSLFILPKIIRPTILLPAHGEPVTGKESIQELLENLLKNIDIAEKIAQNLVQERPDLIDLQLLINLAEKLLLLFPEGSQTPDIEYEMQFAAWTILKKLGVIK